MAAHQPNLDLQRLLNFTPADLDANRQEHLSLEQRGQLVQGYDMIGALAFPIICIAYGVQRLVSGADLGQTLILGGIVVLFLLIERAALLRLTDAIVGQVAQVSGTLHIEVQSVRRRTYWGMIQRQPVAFCTMNNVSLELPAAIQKAYQGKNLRVYYVPGSRKVISAEVMEQP